MYDNPLVGLLITILALYIAKLWYDDYRANASGKPLERGLPGAVASPPLAIAVAVFGALLLVAVETMGENLLAVSDQQSDIAMFFLPVMISAGIIEEIVFRGYLVFTNRGRTALICGMMLASAAFAALHTQYWIAWVGPDTGWFETRISTKSVWTLLVLFANSLWFYFVRFSNLNPARSLLPCFAAHISSNIAVFLVKLAQGHVGL